VAELSRQLLEFESEHTSTANSSKISANTDLVVKAPVSSDFSQAVGESTRSKQALILSFAYLGISVTLGFGKSTVYENMA
jgi:hypothetical protein